MTFDGRRSPARYRRAFATGDTQAISSGAWSTIGGYSTSFPGFSSSVFGVPDGVVATYGLGVITANVDCWIEVKFYCELGSSSTGRRGARIAMDGANTNGVNAANFQAAVTADPMRLEAYYLGPLAATHTLTVQVYQDSGGSLNLTWRQLVIDATAL